MPDQKVYSITGSKPHQMIRTFSKTPKHKMKCWKQSKPRKRQMIEPRPKPLKTWRLNIMMTMEWATGDN